MSFELLKYKWGRKLHEEQFLPTKEDIESKEIKKLANRLKGKSDSETLNNILEWEDKNITPWRERAIMEIPFYILLLIFFFIFGYVSIIPSIIIYSFLSKIIGIYLFLIILLSLFIIFFIFLFLLYKQKPIVNLLCIIIFAYLLYRMLLYAIKFYSTNPPLIKLLDLSIIINWIIFGISLFMLFYMILSYISIFRNDSFLDKIKKLIIMMNNQFSISLTVSNILKYKLAICRDYAKLTSALLLNLYPKSKVYFVLIPNHVAVTIKINKNFYILDQKMPISSLKTWLNRKNKDKAKLLEIKIKNNKIETEFYKTIKIKKIKNILKLNKILNEVINKVEDSIKSNEKKCEYPLKNFTLSYDINDTIIKESLTRTIKNRIKNEFCGNAEKIKKVGICKQENNLVLKIRFKQKRG